MYVQITTSLIYNYNMYIIDTHKELYTGCENTLFFELPMIETYYACKHFIFDTYLLIDGKFSILLKMDYLILSKISKF